MRLLPLLLLLCACAPDDAEDDDPSTTTGPPPDPVLLEVATPVLPTQLLIDLDTDGEEPLPIEVLHEGPTGGSSALPAVFAEGGDRVGWGPPAGGWDNGTHTVRLDPEVALWVLPEGDPVDVLTFDITDRWQGDGRSAEAWTVDTLLLPPSNLGPAVLDNVGELIVVPPDAPGGDWLLLTTLEDCLVYRGPVAVVPSGYELALGPIELDIGSTEGELLLEGTRLSFSFATDGSEGVGHLRTVADGRQVTDLDDDGGIGPRGICDLAGALAYPCHACEPDDTEPLCLDVQAPWIGMLPRSEPLPYEPQTLPSCGVDVAGAQVPELELDLGLEPIQCHGPAWPSWDPDLDPGLGCGCRSVPGRMGLAFAPVVLLWWRRRRGGPAAE